jgi:hypothetical protein
VTTVDEFARRAARLPAVLSYATPAATEAGARVLEAQARANLTAATGGDRRLSGVSSMSSRRGRGGSSNREVDVTVKVEGAGRGARALVVPRGPVSLIEKPTRPHKIPHTFAIVARRNVARRAVHVPGVGVFASVKHPGTRGKRPVTRAFTSHHRQAGGAGLAVFSSIVTEYLATGRSNAQTLGLPDPAAF